MTTTDDSIDVRSVLILASTGYEVSITYGTDDGPRSLTRVAVLALNDEAIRVRGIPRTKDGGTDSRRIRPVIVDVLIDELWTLTFDW